MFSIEYGIAVMPIILLCLSVVISYSVGRIHERYIYKLYVTEMLRKCGNCATLNEAVILMENNTDERYTKWRKGDGYPS